MQQRKGRKLTEFISGWVYPPLEPADPAAHLARKSNSK